MNLERLSQRIHTIPLFSALGAAIHDVAIKRITSWDAWPGPEDPLVDKIGFYQQSLYKAVAAFKEPNWQPALQLIVETGALLVPYEADEDAWYAPNIAVWGAAWTLALEEAYIAREMSVPAELSAQLFWYAQGHWPCALVSATRMAHTHDYVIF